MPFMADLCEQGDRLFAAFGRRRETTSLLMRFFRLDRLPA